MELPDEDTIRILITTDNHVGYNENDPITGDDSWKTFHEIMMIAKDSNVDMVLQAGDLFHVNKPSKKSLYQVMKSLRLACMGDKPCELELLSDPSQVLHYNEFSSVNYEDPNFNISIPVFAISGNHDDASGDSLLYPMDLLHVCGLVNHFGKVLESDKINIKPLLFQKGNTKLALYGLASVRDERLFRTFKEGGISFDVPTMREDEWFNLMCVHQNHTGHTNTAFLPEQFLPDFLDLVVWGHEHECIPFLAHNPNKKFDVLQPGSSVATSLSQAEAQEKSVFILEIRYGVQPKLIPIPLNTVRTFKMKTISLQETEYLRPHDKESISKFLVQQVEEMINEANEEIKTKIAKLGLPNTSMETDGLTELPLPLIRLRVDYSAPENGHSIVDYQVENPRRFSNRFVGQVANSNNVVQFFKKKKITKRTGGKKSSSDDADLRHVLQNGNDELEIQDLVNNMLTKMQLSLLPEVGMHEAIKKFVNKDEKAALKEFIDHEIGEEVDILASNKDFLQSENPEDIKSLIREVKKANSYQTSLETDDLSAQHVYDNTAKTQPHDDNKVVSEPELSDEEVIPSFNKGNNTEPTRTIHKARKNISQSTRKEKRRPMSESIVVSSEEDLDDLNNDAFNNFNANDEDDIITISGDDDKEDYISANRNVAGSTSTRKSATRRGRGNSSTGRKPRSRSSTSATTKTPKTDVLSALIARKRK
ncbi:hypothetical protein KAFR_0B03320 [Kazachstania africana CBS 2517]|uniref:Double-strand break repair protein n=1 Tax=Kazachstania africana (strain ATCC 22294 / BCRC 22015 / CBS 2517 / CECT 1963 / NBRC 1671 / NRRL Y-8276) TaxID=1071382 RepID=H2AQH9_KAZAF|nr:hypothetical protein KAFR_0B03320 [Kazachstania africana CBS 2517]CCF56629.1 hypothetical protein KAFR_0B03320 [Kazachstania africana CBS 2517]